MRFDAGLRFDAGAIKNSNHCSHEVFYDSVEYETVIVSGFGVRAEVFHSFGGIFAEKPEVTANKYGLNSRTFKPCTNYE